MRKRPFSSVSGRAAGVRRVAQLFEPVELGGLRRIGRGAGVDDDDPPARRADPHHLAEHRLRIGEVVHGEPGDDDRKGAVRVGQVGHVALAPCDVGDALLGGEKAGALQHRRGHVDPGRVLDVRGKAAHHDAPAAGDIEHRVAGAGLGRLDDHPERAGVGNRRGGAERRRLPGKLVANEALMCVLGHSLSPYLRSGLAMAPSVPLLGAD